MRSGFGGYPRGARDRTASRSPASRDACQPKSCNRPYPRRCRRRRLHRRRWLDPRRRRPQTPRPHPVPRSRASSTRPAPTRSSSGSTSPAASSHPSSSPPTSRCSPSTATGRWCSSSRTRRRRHARDGIMTSPPVRTGKLTEDQVQSLLELAIRDGGLGSARAEYQNPLVADAPTATFTLNADGAAKTVSVVALGMEDQELTADSAIKRRWPRSATGSATSMPGLAPERALRADRVSRRAPGAAGPRGCRDPRLAVDRPHPRRLLAAQATRTCSRRAPRRSRPSRRPRSGSTGSRTGSRRDLPPRRRGKVYSFVLRPLLPDERRDR